ncbi:hypothetical protein KJ657_02650 [Patescibacteria group bacterium]|nr:hypothetical protein [Patescibacteria group bacterium]MBU1015967.1 hypothetical protein [Patescibacteria group bacterium]MBU1684824.1 hypothetical protein [Patescibacteria group bacterium]MBU1938794.1 hypothetical protein [Patescibacteria group bacterium]
MNFLSSHQQDRNFDLFGLLANRFLYMGKPVAGPEHKIPHDEVSKTEQEAREQREFFAKALDSLVRSYNEKYGEEPEEGGEDAYYEGLILDFSNLPALNKQIDAIIEEKKKKAGTSWANILKNDLQYSILMNITRTVEEYQKLAAQGPELVREARRGRLYARNEMLTEALNRKEAWGKKPLYKELNGIFESLATSDKFKDVWQSPDGLSTPSQREARELFLAIMADKTKNFEDAFVLGDEFGNDAAANIRNFPFIYNEFLKYEGAKITGEAVSPEALDAAEAAAAEATRKLTGMRTAEKIAEDNTDAGLGAVPPIASIPDTPKWEERWRVLNGMVYSLNEKANQEQDSARKAGYVSSAKEMEAHVAHANAYLELSRLKDREKTVQSRFTRIELSHPSRRKLVMELAMKKFMKAKEMVDKGPYGNASWQHALHPTVRRLLIAGIYDTGVARYAKSESGDLTYVEDIKGENAWMLSALALSDYFNFKEVGEKMDPDHEAVLKAAWLGAKAAKVIEDLGPKEEVLQAWKKVKTEVERITDADPQEQERKRRDFIASQMAKFPPDLVERFKNYDVDKLNFTLQQILNNKKRLVEFTESVRKAIKDPYSNESQTFIADMKAGKYAERVGKDLDDLGDMGIIDKISLEGYQRRMFDLQVNYKTAELQEGNMQMFFEGLGIRIEGVYPKYLSIIKDNPKLKTDYWDDLLLRSDAEFKQLTDMFNVILADSIAGGKQDFIAGLQAIRAKYKGRNSTTEVLASLEEGDEDAVVLNTFRLLKEHLSARAETGAISDRKAKEIDAKLRGVHIGDKVSEYVGGVWEMLTGPGQSLANRAAGLVLMYGFYKSARMAMKGEGTAGKMLRALFVAGAVEIAAKEITGRGILDRAGLDSIAGAMEDTYEEVLRQDAETHMEDKEITPEAHGAALKELNDVPFDQVMEWYESSDPNGMPQPPESKDKFPRQIGLSLIAPKVTWVKKDKEREARHVVYETVKHFFGYVGEKDNKRDAIHGKEELKERWIKMYDDPNYKPTYTTYDHLEWFKSGAVKKTDITWQMVMRCEIDPKQVDLTKNKTPVGLLTETAREWYGSLSEWAREHVTNPGSGYAEVFFKSLGEHAQDAKQFFSEVYETGKRKIYFGKERVVLWYGEHEYEIKRTLDGHWQLLYTAVTIPFRFVMAVDNWAIPWTLARLNAVEETLRSTKRETISDKDDFDENNIIERSNLDHLNSSNIELNPKFSYYGLFQDRFLNALPLRKNAQGEIIMAADGQPEVDWTQRGNWFYKDPGDNVGYFISEVSYADAHINMNDPKYSGSPENVASQLLITSKEKAKARFRREGMDLSAIDNHMDSIHEIQFTKSKKMYVFWRMPLKDSAELHLKATGRWVDYTEAGKFKDREPYMMDPGKSRWENLQKAFLLDTGPLRTVLTIGGAYAAQVPRIVFGHIEFAGEIIAGIGKGLNASKEFQDAVTEATKTDESTRILIDEVFTSGKDKHLALSEFYKVEKNAALNEFSLNYAQKRDKKLNLGLLKDEKDYEDSGLYTKDRLDYADMQKFYNDYYVAAKKPNKDIESALNKGSSNAAAPAATP